jgi:beta-glucosidase
MSEGNGEDPYLDAQIAKAMVQGYQGNDLKANNTIMSCVKHFALYGGAEGRSRIQHRGYESLAYVQ